MLMLRSNDGGSTRLVVMHKWLYIVCSFLYPCGAYFVTEVFGHLDWYGARSIQIVQTKSPIWVGRRSIPSVLSVDQHEFDFKELNPLYDWLPTRVRINLNSWYVVIYTDYTTLTCKYVYTLCNWYMYM